MKRVMLLVYFLLGLLVIVFGLVYILQEKLIFFPEKLSTSYQFSFQKPFEEVYLKTSDNATLHALHFKIHDPKGVILYFHGNAGSLRSWGSLGEDLTALGYDVFMPDYRSFGKSTGRLSQENLYADAQLAYHYLLKNYPEAQIVIFGRSIGTGIATRLTSKNNPKLLILESPFYSFADVAKHHYSFLPVSLMLKYSFLSNHYLPQVKCPTFIIHGTQDDVVPFKSGLKLARLLANPTSFIPIEGGGHNDLSYFPAYQVALNEILN